MRVLHWCRYSLHKALEAGVWDACYSRVYPTDLADRLPACRGRYSSGGSLLLGQLAGVCDQHGGRDVHEESGEGQPGPGEHLRDDGGEALALRQVQTPDGEHVLPLAPRSHHGNSPFAPLTPDIELGE